MKYKKDPWYIGGMISALFSAAVMLITMIFMYFGSNLSIIIFFAMCPVLTAGLLICRSVINRYNDAEISNGEPLPMFWRIRFAVHNLKVLIITRNLWRVIITTVTCIFLAVTIVLTTTLLLTVYTKNGAENDYYFNQRNYIYDQNFDVWQRARQNGNDKFREISFSFMQEMLEENSNNRDTIEATGLRIDSLIPWTVASGILTVVSAAFLLSYIQYKRLKAKRSEA